MIEAENIHQLSRVVLGNEEGKRRAKLDIRATKPSIDTLRGTLDRTRPDSPSIRNHELKKYKSTKEPPGA